MEVGIAAGPSCPRAISIAAHVRKCSDIIRWTIAIVCILFTGCTVCENARRTMCTEPHLFHWKKDKRRSLAVYSAWADDAWQEHAHNCTQLDGGSADYIIGFRDGFVDYVYAGGTGEPPPVPPRHLWNVDFRNGEGHQRAEDWFAGYRHGAQVARDEGYRDLATIRSSVLGLPPEPSDIYGEDGWQGGYGGHDAWPATEPLPEPDAPPTPDLNGPTPPTDTVTPRDTESTSEPPLEAPERDVTPSEEPGLEFPATKPMVPPPPRNLPSTLPRNLPPPGSDEQPLDLENHSQLPTESLPADNPPAEAPATEPRATEEMEPAPLSIPAETKDQQPAESVPTSTPATPEPNTSSVRILGTPTASRPPRALPTTAPPPSHLRVKATSGRPAARSETTVIRLTAGTSSGKPTNELPQRSTVRIATSPQ